MKFFYFFITLILCSYSNTKANSETTALNDSLLTTLSSTESDSGKVLVLSKLCWLNRFEDPEKAKEYGTEGLALAKKSEYKEGVSRCLNNLGELYRLKGEYGASLQYHNEALKIREELGNKKGVAASLCNIGMIYTRQGNYAMALEYQIRSLKMDEEYYNENGGEQNLIDVAKSHTSIAIIYYYMEDYDNSLLYFKNCLELDEQVGDKREIATDYNNIGAVYCDLDSLDEALQCHLNSLRLKNDTMPDGSKVGNKYSVNESVSNIGNIYYAKEEYDNALEHYMLSLKISTELEDKQGMAETLNNIGLVYERMDKTKNALDYYFKSLALAEEINSAYDIKMAYTNLAFVYAEIRDFENAYRYNNLLMSLKDSLYNAESLEKITEMQTKYETEKKEKEIALLEKDNEIKKVKLNKQQILIYSFVLGFIIVAVFSIIILRLFRLKQKANKDLKIKNDQISQQNEEIQSQRDEIEAQRDKVQDQKERIEELYDIAIKRKNLVEAQKEEIEDSIRYAKRIQTAVLPADAYADSILGEHFVLFRPKDVVSGDFYWATKTEDWTIVTAADCTGHGVPGAFMSMLGVSFLNEIVRKKDVTNSAEVLNHLRESVIEALKQTGEAGTAKDGMDMSIIAINNLPAGRQETKRALWAGANNPLWIIRNREVKTLHGASPITDPVNNIEDLLHDVSMIEEIKGDKMPVAVYMKMDDFNNHELELAKGDQIYLFTDGYPDQFGGAKGKKFMYKPFKRILVENSGKPMLEQKKALESTLDEWMNYEGKVYEQIDDITVLGIQI